MRILVAVLFVLFFSSCSCFQQEKELSDYLTWLNNESNGLVKKKYINGLIFTAKYLPPDYLVYQELKDDTLYTDSHKDSLLDMYAHNMTFLLTVQPDERDKESDIADVMYLGVKNMNDYQERVMLLNFEIKEYLHLEAKNASYSPVLTNLENTYSLGSGRNITCVFSPLKDKNEFSKTDTLDLVWDDEIFESGRNHFVFVNQDFSSLPRLKF